MIFPNKKRRMHRFVHAALFWILNFEPYGTYSLRGSMLTVIPS